MSAKDYVSRINQIIQRTPDPSDLTTKPELKLYVKELNQTKRELGFVKKEINQEIKDIRARYRDKTSTAGMVGGSFLKGLGKRGAGKSYQASRKRGLNDKRDREIQSYDSAKLHADKAVNQIEKMKISVQRAIENI